MVRQKLVSSLLELYIRDEKEGTSGQFQRWRKTRKKGKLELKQAFAIMSFCPREANLAKPFTDL